MTHLKALDAARDAVAANAGRPATATIYDSEDVRMVVFRLGPGQSVPPHRNKSTVTLPVLDGLGIISGETEEVACAPGDVVAYSPNELHGMRAVSEDFLLLAEISPRPGTR